MTLLRDLGKDAWGMGALRRIYAEARGVTSICTEGDAAVLEGLARRLVTGELKVRRVPLSSAAVPYVGELAAAAAPAKKTAVEEKAQGSLTNPRWSVPRVEVGTDLFAVVTYTGLTKPVDATIVISELDGSTARQEIAKIYTEVPAGSGNHKVKWKRKPEEAQADLAVDAAAGDSGPLEYRFQVETKDPACPGESGPLWLTNTVTVKLVKDEDGSKHDKARIVVLKDALGEQLRATSKDGEAKFEKVLVGPIEIRLAEPRFTDLGWSTPEVPVGKPVDAVFKFEDAIRGTKVEVVIHEFNADGTSGEVKRVEVELKAASGEVKVSFTRTEHEAQEDVAADEGEGDTGPVEYRYFVATEDGGASEASEPLWLMPT